MRSSIFLFICALTAGNAATNPWDVFQIHRHVETKTNNKNVDEKYSITLLKSGAEKFFKDFRQNENSSGVSFDSFVDHIDKFVSDIDQSVNDLKDTNDQSNRIYNLGENVTLEDVNRKNLEEDFCQKIKRMGNDTINIFVLNGTADDECIRNIARVAITDDEAVILFGINELTTRTYYLDLLLRRKALIYDEFYVLPHNFSRKFGHYRYRAYITSDDVSVRLYNLVNNSQFFLASLASKHVEARHIRKVVDRLLKEGNEKIVPYAYKLWDNDGEDIVLNLFPESFGMILNGTEVKIVHNRKNGPLRLSSDFTDADRALFADCSRNHTEDLYWKFVPIWKNNSVSFKIKNPYYNMYLKLQYNPDCYGDRVPWGATSEWFYQVRFRWSLVPVKSSVGDDTMFCIVNSEYGQSLTSSHCTDEDQEVIGTRSPCQPDLAWSVTRNIKSYYSFDINNSTMLPEPSIAE